MIWALLPLAFADPTPLRAVGDGPQVVLDAGTPWWGVGVWTSERFGVSVGARGLWAVQLAAGWHWELARGPKGWGTDLTVAPSVTVPTLDPALGIGQTTSIQLGVRGDRGTAVFGFVLDTQLGLSSDPTATLVALMEPRLELHAGPVWLGVRGAMGAKVQPGPTTLELQAALTARIPY